MSQSALSKQIIHLESELRVKLFDRNTTPISLTPAGEYFLKEAQTLLFKEDQLLRSLERYKTGDAGRLTIGISPFRSQYLVSDVLKKVRAQYPGIQIVLHEANSDTLRKETAEGKYDFSIINLPVDDSILDVMPLEADVLVLAVPKEFVCLIEQNSTEISFADCKKLPFVVVGQTQEMRQLFNKLCIQSDIQPEIVMEVVGITTAYHMAKAGIGATLVPLQFIAKHQFDADVQLFRLNENVAIRQPAVVTRHGQYLPEYAQYAIDLLTS